MSDISKIKPNGADGDEYNLKDTFAREEIQSTKSTIGNPITITDAAPINAESLTVDLEPIQDLHGYSNPWVGGAGKNKFDADTTYASYKQSDGSYRLTGSNAHGIYNYISSELVGKQLTFSAYIDCSKETSPNYIRIYAKVNGQNIIGSDMGSGNKGFIKVTFTLQSTSDYFGFTYGNSGGNYFTMSDLQVEEGSERTTYHPYSNICPISGYDEVEVESVGKNKFGFTASDFANGVVYGSAKRIAVDFPPGTYSASSNCPTGYLWVGTMEDWSYNRVYDGKPRTFTLSEGEQLYVAVNKDDIEGSLSYQNQIELGQTATQYEPYRSSNASITFGQTVYGGTVDFKTGVVTVDRALVDLGTDATFEYVSALAVDNIFPFRVSNRKYDSAAIAPISDKIKVTKKTSWSIDENEIIYIDQQDSMRIRIPNCTTVAQIETATTGMHLCYGLATPTTLHLTPQELKILQNTNNITTNGTTITLGYQPNNVVGELKGDIETEHERFYTETAEYAVTFLNNARCVILATSSSDYIPIAAYTDYLFVAIGQLGDNYVGYIKFPDMSEPSESELPIGTEIEFTVVFMRKE